MKLHPMNDVSKCAGESPTGTMKCAYRDACARFVRPGGDRQVWSDFWRGTDDCPHYESIPREAA